MATAIDIGVADNVHPTNKQDVGKRLEAMQAGLPIVATATEGARHLAPQLQSPLVPVDDPDAMALALQRMVAGGQRRMAYPMEQFRIESKLEQIEAFYLAGLARLRGG